MRVKKDFFCIQTKKVFKKGDEYTGDRKDLAHVVEYEDKSLAPKRTTKGHKRNKK